MNKSTIINLVLAAKLPCYNYPHAFVFELNGTVHECFEYDGEFHEDVWDNLTLAEYHADWENTCNGVYAEPLVLSHIFRDASTLIAIKCINLTLLDVSKRVDKLNEINDIAHKYNADVEWCGFYSRSSSNEFIIHYNGVRYFVNVDSLRHDGVNARLQSI